MQNTPKLKKAYGTAIGIAVIVILIIVGTVIDNRNGGNGSITASSTALSAASTTMEMQASSTAVSTSTPAQKTVTASIGGTQVTFMTSSSTPTTANDAVLVLSPNGAESWNEGSIEPISWKVWERYLSYSTFDIYMVPQSGSCIYPMPCALNPISVAKSIYNSKLTYLWQVGDAANLPAGSYKAEVCFTGTKVCDMSDQPFTITTTATSSPECPTGYSWSGVECKVMGSPIQPN